MMDTDGELEIGGEMESEPRQRWAGGTEAVGQVFVETGRGQAMAVDVGAPFKETIERLANEAHYGGYFRVFLNGDELIDPDEAPDKVEAGMRIAITSYDKVG